MRLIIASVLVSSTWAFAAENPPTWGAWTTWGAQPDGTFSNPVLPADYSDIDITRVGDSYYAIASTMQYAPGMTVLMSRDLVHWRLAGHAVADLTQISPALNWDRQDRQGRGVWAGGIRHHAGRFWVFFGTPDEGYFMTSATDPAGPWTPLHTLKAEAGWDDCCPFWDEDGQAWFVGTHFKDGYKTYLWRMSADGTTLDEGSRTLINQGFGREANKLFKIDGWYYHFYSEHRNGARTVWMQRARSLPGPWEGPRQLTAPNREAKEPNQGGLVQVPDGSWWFFTHHGNGSWEGRAASLLPVTWVDGWPILGGTDAQGAPGTMVWKGRIPVPGQPAVMPQTSDDFAGTILGHQWQWRYQPRPGSWSLTARPGWMRLTAFPALRGQDIRSAGTILTQRPYRSPGSSFTATCDIGGMVDGQRAALLRFAKDWSSLEVVQAQGVRRLECRIPGQPVVPGPVLTGPRLWLRTSWGVEPTSQFSYSLDGTTFTDLGAPAPLGWGGYRGDRIGLTTIGDGGVFDVDAVVYDLPSR